LILLAEDGRRKGVQAAPPVDFFPSRERDVLMVRFGYSAVAVLVGILLFGGCLKLQRPEKPVRFYTLEYAEPEHRVDKPLGSILQVNRFGVAPTYNTRRMIYREGDFRRDAYIYSQWRDNPGEMVSYFLARDLRGSGYFNAVVPHRTQAGVTHVLEGYVEEFFEWDFEEGWEAVLTVSITLTKALEPDVSRKVIRQKTYRVREPFQEKTPTGLAAAMSRAMRALSRQVIEDVYNALR